MAADLCFGSSFPLKQTLAGEHAADQRSHYGVHRNQHLVRQKYKAQKDIEVSDEQGVQRVTCNHQLPFRGRADQVEKELEPHRYEKDADSGNSPISRRDR